MRFVVALAVIGMAGGAMAQSTYHRGYTTRDGTYVQPHYQTAPDSSRLNNWSTQGNVNPYTGQAGTVNPYSMPQPAPAPSISGTQRSPSYGSGWR